MKNCIDTVIARAEQRPEASDYTKGGVILCGLCHAAKETVCTLPNGAVIKIPCLCQCQTESRDAERAERKRREEFEQFQQLRKDAITDPKFQEARFDNSDGREDDSFLKLERYANDFQRALDNNIGLCLVGAPGTGKTFAAACVANYLLDRQVFVQFTNLSRVINSMSDFNTDKNAYVDRLTKCPLLILDDFGVERQTGYALEIVYGVIDGRYRSGKPLIVTTNLSWDEIKNPADLTHKRIFDRIVEMCTPVSFGAAGRRQGIANQKREIAAKILNG